MGLARREHHFITINTVQAGPSCTEVLAWAHSQTADMTSESRRPDVAVTRSDHARLLRLADTLSRRNAELGLQLFQELERAEILPDDTPRDIVRM